MSTRGGLSLVNESTNRSKLCLGGGLLAVEQFQPHHPKLYFDVSIDSILNNPRTIISFDPDTRHV